MAHVTRSPNPVMYQPGATITKSKTLNSTHCNSKCDCLCENCP